MGNSIVGTGYSFSGSTGGSGNTEANYLIFDGIAGQDLTLGAVVRFDRAVNPGRILKAQATDFDSSDAIGVTKSGATTNNSVTIYIVGEVPVNFDVAPPASANGSRVYVSQGTPGVASLVIPTAPGVVYLVGRLTGANGASLSPSVLLNPQLISVLR